MGLIRSPSLNSHAPIRLKPPDTTLAYYASFISLSATVSIDRPALPWQAQHTASRLAKTQDLIPGRIMTWVANEQN